MNILSKVYQTVSESVINAPCYVGGNTLFGYVYAKLAELPVREIVIAFAVWSAVETILLAIATSMGRSLSEQKKFKAIFLTASSIVALQELWQEQLLGEKMLVCLVLIRTLLIASFIVASAIDKKKELL